MTPKITMIQVASEAHMRRAILRPTFASVCRGALSLGSRVDRSFSVSGAV
jgi:hypothetical protein